MTNVLLVLTDDVGVEQYTTYGRGGAGTYGYPATPWVTALYAGGTVQGVTYAGGVKFNRHYGEQLCSPTRAAIQTGRHPFRTGIGDLVRDDAGNSGIQTPLFESEYTLAKLLKANGYACGCFGKWHLGNTDDGGALCVNRAGFDAFAGNLYNQSNGATHTVGGTVYAEGYYAVDLNVNGKSRVERVYYTTSVVNNALRWIADQGSNPWYCYLPVFGAHLPTNNDATANPVQFNTPPTNLYNAATWTHAADVTHTTTQQAMHAFRSVVEATDTECARLIAGIKGLPGGQAILDNTLIVWSSDNGTVNDVLINEQHPTLGLYPSGHSKDAPYEPGIWAPLIIAGKGVVSPIRVSNQLTSQIDLYPTIASMLGVSIPPDVNGVPLKIDGVDMSTTVKNIGGLQPFFHATVYSERFQPDGVVPLPQNLDNGRTLNEWCIQDGIYTLVYNGIGSTLEFYVVGPTASYNPMQLTNLTPGGSTAGLNAGQLAAFNSLFNARRTLLLS